MKRSSQSKSGSSRWSAGEPINVHTAACQQRHEALCSPTTMRVCDTVAWTASARPLETPGAGNYGDDIEMNVNITQAIAHFDDYLSRCNDSNELLFEPYYGSIESRVLFCLIFTVC